MPRKCFLDILTKLSFFSPHDFFLDTRIVFLQLRKHVFLQEKLSCGKRKHVLSPYIENISLALKIISVGVGVLASRTANS